MDRRTDRLIIKMNGASRFLDHENIVPDTKIIIYMLSFKSYGPKVFLHNDGQHNAPVFGQHTDCKELWNWSRPKLAHVKIRAHSCYW